MKKRFLIVGSGGREASFALRLVGDVVLYAVIDHENPTIVDAVIGSGGEFLLGDSADAGAVTGFAVRSKIDYAFVSADNPLANGVVDALLDAGIKAIGGTKAASRIEWDKVFSIEMMRQVCPEMTPFFEVVANKNELQNALQKFADKKLDVVVKPQGLTGGKGVKVMPQHLKNYQECEDYATQLLQKNAGEKVLLVEKLNGIEFTIMGITDGVNLAMTPASYDYPFRLENDLGAGTGGMGCFTNVEKKLPFMNEKDLKDCQEIMQKIIDKMRADGLFFNGVLNGGFFKTADGIKFMEFNGRFGDPEGLNVLSVFEGSFAEFLIDIWDKNLAKKPPKFCQKASVVKYLVAKEYPDPAPVSTIFSIDQKAIEKLGASVIFASCVRLDDGRFETLKKSRVVAICATADTIEAAGNTVNLAIQKHINGGLDYRHDIGTKADLAKLQQLAEEMQK